MRGRRIEWKAHNKYWPSHDNKYNSWGNTKKCKELTNKAHHSLESFWFRRVLHKAQPDTSSSSFRKNVYIERMYTLKSTTRTTSQEAVASEAIAQSSTYLGLL